MIGHAGPSLRLLLFSAGSCRRTLVALGVGLSTLVPSFASAQEPAFASAAVTIGFAPSGDDSVGRGVTIAFQNATTTADGRDAIAIGFGSPVPPAALLGKPPNAAFNADPVNTATGNYLFEHLDLAVPGRGPGLAFSRFYNSLDATSGALGPGWTHSYNVTLVVLDAGRSVEVRWGDGHVDYYDRSAAVYVPRFPGLYDTLSAGTDGTFSIVKKTQTRWHFTTAGRLDSITDRNGNVVTLGYDGAGRLVTVQDPAGRLLSLTYDGAGRIAAIADPLPRTVAFAYDSAGQLTSVTDVDGGVETYTYDGNRQLLTATDPRGATYLTNTYDAARRVVTWQADAKGNRFQFAYDPASGQTTITDPMGRASVDAHDVRGRLIRRTNRLGQSISYTYDDQNNRTSVVDQNGNRMAYTYDDLGNVIGKVNPLGQTTAITYDALNNPLTRIDEGGGVTRFTYDSVGNPLSTTDPVGHVTTFTYDGFGQMLTSTNANGGVTTQAYDSAGNVVSVTDPIGAVTALAYDAVGRKISSSDPLGHTTLFTYDGSGRLLTTTDSLGHVVTHVYDPNGNRTQTTDVRDGVTAFTYDANNLLTTMRDALGGVTRHAYDALNRRVTTTDARGMVSSFAHDAEGRLTQTTEPTGGITRTTYDGVGNQTAVTDANGRTTRFAYDVLNRLTSTTDALGRVTRQTYDALGRVTATTDAAGRVTTMAYDPVGHLLQVTDPAGGTARHTYDGVGNRLTVTDPNNHTTTFKYDGANRLITSADSLGQQFQYTYDAAGNRTRLLDAKAATLAYRYDALNRLIAIQPPAGSTITFGYDAAGNRTASGDAVGSTAYTYDALGRLTRYVDAYGQAIGYEYDSVGNRTALVYPDSKRVSYVFDGSQRLTRVTDWGGRVTQYLYDAAGQLTGTVNSNGTTVASAYDASGQLTNLDNKRADGSVLASYAYTLDAVGNRTSVVQNEPLPAAAASTIVPYTYNAANQIQTAGATSFASDRNGNLTSRVAVTGTTAYAWDVHDRLTQVSDGTTTAQYVYSGLGTRLARTVNGVTTRFVVDTQPTLSQLLVETDSSGTPTARYVYGLGLIARIDAAGTALTYHFDPRGSTVAMTDGRQAMVNRYAYDEFGAVLGKHEAVPQAFNYVGQWGVMQEPNGLLFMRARYMAASEGRFISRDPAPTFSSLQDLNLFAYVNNNSILLIDPRGLSPFRRGSATSISSSAVETTDQQHAQLVGAHHLSADRARRIIEYQQEALAYELESIRQNRNADILQGVADALGTTAALLTGNVVGVGAGLSKQASTLLSITGNQSVGEALAISANLVDQAYGLFKFYQAATTLGPAIQETGIAFRNVQRIAADSSLGKLYLDLVAPVPEVFRRLFR